MKNIKNFSQFINEDYTEAAEDAGLYDDMGDLLHKALVLYCKFDGTNPEEFNDFDSPEDAMESLDEIPDGHELYSESQELYSLIDAKNDEMDETEAQSFFKD